MRRKRIAAWLLCAALMLGLLPATAWAAPPDVKPKAEQIKGFTERDVVQIICQDDASHNKGYAMISNYVVWAGPIAEPHRKTMTVNGISYCQYYVKDYPDNHHVRMAGETHIDIHFTWSEDEQLWVPDDPDQLPVTFYVEEVPDIYEGRLSLLDEKAVRFVPTPGNASHETVYCDRGFPSYWRVSNTHRTLSFSAWEYIGQLNAVCGGQHELVGDATGTINLNYDKTDKQWKADKTWVEFPFTCNRAELPTLEEAAALVGDVTVRCADGHAAQIHRLQDAEAYYAEFTSDDTCRLTVYHAALVRQFCGSNSVNQQHIFAPDQSDRTELALVRDAATGAWTLDSDSQSTLPLTIQASCDRPATPTEKELDRMEGAVIVRYAEVVDALSLQYRMEPGTYGYRDPGESGDSRSTVASSDDLTRWEYRIWLENTWPYRERYNKHRADGNADAYRALTKLQPRISLVYDNGWRVATPLSGDSWDGRAYIMLTQTHSEHHDLNGDDDKSIGDMACLYTWLTTGKNSGKLADKEFEDKADLNHDGTVDIYDLQMLYEHINGIR